MYIEQNNRDTNTIAFKQQALQ